MVNNVLFRGKRIDNGEWVYGYFVSGKYYIEEEPINAIFPTDVTFFPACELDGYEIVDPKTVSQYTGKNDVDGKKIFGGDIVQFCEDDRYTFEVAYHGCEWCLINGIDSRLIHYYCGLANYQQLKRIGNIWDNPELLEDKDE